jgi:hypothetical protein
VTETVERKPFAIHREYYYTPEGLAKALGLEGIKVTKVTSEFGGYSIFTIEGAK